MSVDKGLYSSPQGLGNCSDPQLQNLPTYQVRRSSTVKMDNYSVLNVIGAFQVTLDMSTVLNSKQIWIFNTGLGGPAIISATHLGSGVLIDGAHSISVPAGATEGQYLYWDGSTLATVAP